MVPMAAAGLTSVKSAVPADLPWQDAGGGYQLALHGDKLLCRNAKGQLLQSVPKDVRESAVGQQLQLLRDWLADHQAQCAATVETWLLRSLPVPAAVLAALWPDPAWRQALQHGLVQGLDGGGRPLPSAEGLLMGAQDGKGLGLVNRDGETVWLQAPLVRVAHPVLVAELDDWRALLAELGAAQGVHQLLRETFAKPATCKPHATEWSAFAGGQFEELRTVQRLAQKHGFGIRGGSALCRVVENGRVVEARYYIGEGDPEWETTTDDLCWFGADDEQMPLGDVGPVAWSEGVRMATLLYAGRQVEEKTDD